MKNLTVILLLVLAISCQENTANENEGENQAEMDKERSIGFIADLPDSKWHLGQENAVEVVKKFDGLWGAKDFEAMRPFLSDTLKYYFADGRKGDSPDGFIQILTDDASDDTWTFDFAYSVDLDPEIGGEHVQAAFTGYAIADGDTTTTYYHESYYIIQGKITWWNQFTQKTVVE
jgi:hypothetical protein